MQARVKQEKRDFFRFVSKFLPLLFTAISFLCVALSNKPKEFMQLLTNTSVEHC